ncbi:hypothetical protein [Catenuloplanes japonicus]|uniref:hypothetical protein n=1 Tax=Catenuloplanes japonicus TaxID=33876 RepID=UPI00052707B6|nr:hypothetical protein [Catenuloplanes japonicus]
MTGRGIAFDFARDLRKPEVRERLALLGFDGDAGDVILPWFDDETHAEASRRIPADCRRALLVAPDADLPSGWTMQWAKPQPWPPNNSRRPCRWRVDFGRLKQRRQEEDLMCDENYSDFPSKIDIDYGDITDDWHPDNPQPGSDQGEEPALPPMGEWSEDLESISEDPSQP